MPEPDNIYTFSPNTILSDLDQGKVDTFIILPNKEGDLPSKYLGDINWDELDYWKVAGALHTGGFELLIADFMNARMSFMVLIKHTILFINNRIICI